jgi:hypothetical protein
MNLLYFNNLKIGYKIKMERRSYTGWQSMVLSAVPSAAAFRTRCRYLISFLLGTSFYQ